MPTPSPTSSCTRTPPTRSSTAPRRPRSWRAAAAVHGYPALALTDHDGLWGAMEFAHAAQGARDQGDHRRRADASTDGSHLTLLVERPRRLPQPLPPGDARARRTRATNPREPGAAAGLARPARATRRGARLPLRLRARRRCSRGGSSAATSTRPSALGAAAARRVRRATASGSSSSGRSGAATARATARSRSSRSGSASPCVATGNVHAHHPDRARLQDAFVAVRLRSSLDQTEPERRGNASSVMALAGRDGRALPRPPRRGRRDGAARRAARVRPHARPRLPLPRLGGPRRRPQARRALPGAARRRATRRRPSAGGRRAPGRGAARDPHARPVRLLPAPSRPARARARGRGGGARPRLGALAAPARARARLERQLDRLLPHRPLAHRPDREQAAARALPERGDHVAARHRPRLPARHPREAHPARARALRDRARRARRGVRDLPLARRDPRPRQGARPARRRDRAGRALGGHIWRPATTSRAASPR